MTNEKFSKIMFDLQLIINTAILITLINVLINISNTNKCLNKINEKVGANIHCTTNFVGLVKCNVD